MLRLVRERWSESRHIKKWADSVEREPEEGRGEAKKQEAEDECEERNVEEAEERMERESER